MIYRPVKNLQPGDTIKIGTFKYPETTFVITKTVLQGDAENRIKKHLYLQQTNMKYETIIALHLDDLVEYILE